MINPSNCEEAGQVKLCKVRDMLPGQDRKLGILNPHMVLMVYCIISFMYHMVRFSIIDFLK